MFALPKTILGREPAAIAALIQGILPVLILLHIAWLTAGQVGLIAALVAAVTACYVAYATHQATLAVVVGTIQAGIALGAGYGWTLDPKDVAVIVATAGVVFNFFSRTQSTPVIPDPRKIFATGGPLGAREERWFDDAQKKSPAAPKIIGSWDIPPSARVHQGDTGTYGGGVPNDFVVTGQATPAKPPQANDTAPEAHCPEPTP